MDKELMQLIIDLGPEAIGPLWAWVILKYIELVLGVGVVVGMVYFAYKIFKGTK